jgi:hypothetical protein
MFVAAFEDWINFLPVIIVVAVLIFAVASVWLADISKKKRMRQVERAAGELSLVYRESLSDEDQLRLSVFPLMQMGGGGLSTNAVIADNDAARLILFDHKYTLGSGKNQSTHRQTVAWMTSDAMNLPQFSLSPESWWHRMGDLLTKQDIDFDEDPEFSNRFLLKGTDSADIRNFFNANRRQALLKINKPSIEAHGRGFIFFRPGQLVPTDQMKEFMNDAFSVFQTLVG